MKHLMMPVTKPDGRALPPRPTLLVGDAVACAEAYDRLVPHAQEYLSRLSEHCSASQLQLLETTLQRIKDAGGEPNMQHFLGPGGRSVLDSRLQHHRDLVEEVSQLVGRLRWFRETIVSNDMLDDPLACHVYELSCDLAAAYGRDAAPELFKALQGVTREVYPRALPQHRQRAAEMHAAYLILLATSPARPSHAEIVALLKDHLTSPHLHHQHMKWALKVVSCASCGDWYSFLQLRSKAPTRLLRDIMEFKLGQVQTVGLLACAASYRSLPWSAVDAMLHLDITPHHAHRAPQDSHQAGDGGSVVGHRKTVCNAAQTSCSSTSSAAPTYEGISLAGLRPGSDVLNRTDKLETDPWGDDEGTAGEQSHHCQPRQHALQTSVQSAERLTALLGTLLRASETRVKTIATALQTLLETPCDVRHQVADVVFKK